MRWIRTLGLPRATARGLLRGVKSTLRLSAAVPARSVRVAAAGAAVLALGTLACRETSRPELGAAQYREYCASCHGEIGPDGGVIGRKSDAPDLTALAARFGSPLRRDELAAFIDGRRELQAHGTRDMPVWGARLYESYPQTPGTEAVRGGTVELLVDYLEFVQRR